MIADYLEPWDAIMARLRREIPELRAVISGPDLATVRESQQPTPMVAVLYLGDQVDGGTGARAGSGAAQVVHQLYLTVLAIKNVRDPVADRGPFAQAGPLVSRIIDTLSGWRPSENFRALRRVQAPTRPDYQPGFFYLPLAFTCQLVTVATPD